MATVGKFLSSPRVKNLFKDIAEEKKRKMSCGDVRVAIQLRGLGVIRLLPNERNDVTTSWVVTKIGETYVD